MNEVRQFKVGDLITIRDTETTRTFAGWQGEITRFIDTNKNKAAGPCYSVRTDKHDKNMGFYETELEPRPISDINDLTDNYEVD